MKSGREGVFPPSLIDHLRSLRQDWRGREETDVKLQLPHSPPRCHHCRPLGCWPLKYRRRHLTSTSPSPSHPFPAYIDPPLTVALVVLVVVVSSAVSVRRSSPLERTSTGHLPRRGLFARDTAGLSSCRLLLACQTCSIRVSCRNLHRSRHPSY
jgi:hypothetical protein